MTRLERAVMCYLEAGWPVVPVAFRQKRPLVAWRGYQTRAPGRLEWLAWLGKWPAINVALVCGRLSGLYGLDCDGPGAMAWLKTHWAPRGPCVQTPRGFRWLVRRTRRVSPRTLGGDGWSLTVLGENSLFLLPPSTHPTGPEYAWKESPHFLGGSIPEVFPEFLSGQSFQDTQEKDFREKGKYCSPVQYHPLNLSSYNHGDPPRVMSSIGVPQGQRNSTLYRHLCRIARHGVPPRVLLAEAHRLNRTYLPPLGDTEVQTIARSAARHATGP